MAGTAGLVVIVAVMGIIIFQSSSAGFPAVASGEFPLWKVKVPPKTPHTPIRLDSACAIPRLCRHCRGNELWQPANCIRMYALPRAVLFARSFASCDMEWYVERSCR